MPVDEVRKLIGAVDDHRTRFNSPPFISKRLRELIEIPEPINDKKSIDELQQNLKRTTDELKQQTKDELKRANDELKQANEELKQQMSEMKELLNRLINNP